MVGTLDDMRGGVAADSPVFNHARRLQPGVSVPSSPLVLAMGVAVAALLGLVVFLTLQSNRQAEVRQAEQAYQQANPPYVPPPPAPMIVVPPTPDMSLPAETMPPPVFSPMAPAMQVVPPGQDQSRLRAPAMVVDFSGPAGEAAPMASLPGPAGPAPKTGPDEKMSAEERFAARVAGTQAETATASRLANPGRVAAQGTIIPAVLETAINSDLPGYTRAVVSRDVKSFDGVRVLIPRGSKLIGEYRSGVASGQSRAFVVWSRILTPDGVSIDIGSPGADRLGRGGLQGDTDTRFFRRFGSSILLSVLSAGLQAAAYNNSSPNTAIIIGSPQQAASVAQTALQKEIDIPPTIKVPQGEPIRVFVARDLDFSAVGGR
jgi:type IV secretory pathway VirB10-like protein